MKQEDINNLEYILNDFNKDLSAKYTKGNAEHGGHLFDKDCLTLLLQEITDLVPYAYNLKRHRQLAIALLREIIKGVPQVSDIVKVINLLECGNTEGVKYED